MSSARGARKAQEAQAARAEERTPVTTSDETVAGRAAAGEREAFNILILRYRERLYRFVRRYVGNADDAYDVLQDTFVSAWMALPRYDRERSFASWIHTIALNKCRDFSRRQRVRRALLRFVAVQAGETADLHAESAEAETRMAATMARLDKAIASLPAVYKEALLLTVFEGLSHEEAARTLKTTRKSVEMRVYRARRRLAAAIAREE